MKSTPALMPNTRSSRSLGVSASARTATPGWLMPLLFLRMPPWMTFVRMSFFLSVSRTLSSKRPSSRRMRSPGFTSAARWAYVVETISSVPFTVSSVVMRNSPPSLSSVLPLMKRPVRIFGPWRSPRMPTALRHLSEAPRSLAMFSACCSWLPWEKLSRATSIPASISASSISWLWLAGPRVQTIFARRMAAENRVEPRKGSSDVGEGRSIGKLVKRNRSASQQQVQVLPLPTQCGSVEGKSLLPLAEGAGMMHPAARGVRAGEELVEHLVEDDELHEEGGHLGAVQGRVDADLPRLVIVAPQADGLAPTARGHAAPADARLDGVLEAGAIEAIEEGLEIEEAAPGVEIGLGRMALLADARLLPPDVIVQHPTGDPVAAAGVVRHRANHALGRVEEHVVQPQLQRIGAAAEGHHGGAVVRDRQPHRHPQVRRQVVGECLRARPQLIAGGLGSERPVLGRTALMMEALRQRRFLARQGGETVRGLTPTAHGRRRVSLL